MVKDEASVFSRAGALDALERLFDAGRKFPLWIVSYGNAAVDLETLVEMIGRFKTITHAEEIPYVHLTGLSSKEHKVTNREFLIVAR